MEKSSLNHGYIILLERLYKSLYSMRKTEVGSPFLRMNCDRQARKGNLKCFTRNAQEAQTMIPRTCRTQSVVNPVNKLQTVTSS